MSVPSLSTRRLKVPLMYIIAIAWLYVTLLMAVTETSWIAGLMTFIFYGLFPLAVLLYLMGTPERRRRNAQRRAAAQARSDDGSASSRHGPE